MNIAAYLDEVRAKYASGQATEHSYRPALSALFESIDPSLTVINEPKQSEGGMPDFLFQRGDVPVGWCEAKDIDKDVIRLKGYSKDQRKRYEAAYPNLIYTNGVDFEFIREGEAIHFVSIADFLMGLQPVPDRFDELERQLKNFAAQKPISIRSAKRLAQIMAAKAAIMKDEIGIALADDPDFRSGLGIQFKSFKANLLPALEPDEFADLYAETITYGMFAARFHDTDLNTFSRQEAMEDLPASNPFLKGLFQYIAGPGLPKRLVYIVDDLVQVMRASDPHSLFKDYGKWDARNDPFIHFYEDFLKEYNPAKRKSRGVYYTPEPVVNFIVRAVDDVLKTEFGLADGLADTSKVTVNWDTGSNDNKGKAIFEKREVHRVQILDPATGTGTFLAEVVRTISDRVKARAPGKWSGYVEQELLPRLHGFELLMASYAMCHLKLDMMLGQTGYKPSAKPPRLSVWLTNALEPADRQVADLFMPELVEEARGASDVKRQTPIMCVIGNPPYSGISQNMGDWINGLIDDYKYVDGRHFGERKHWLHDDYVKFIRLADHLISKNASGGVLGFITNHGFLDNPTFRGMRWHLLKTFEKIWVVDLHGNANKRETPPAGQIDKNVFDIRQGVALIIGMRGEKKTDHHAEVWHGELWGSRDAKGSALFELNRTKAAPVRLHPSAPHFMLSPHDDAASEHYEKGFSLNDLMRVNVTGIATARDHLVIGSSKSELTEKIGRFLNPSRSDREVRMEFYPTRKDGKYLAGDTRGWKISTVRPKLRTSNWRNDIVPVYYRPFDRRWIIYRTDMIDWGRQSIMNNYLDGPNIGLLVSKAHNDACFAHILAIDQISEVIAISGTTASNAMNVPLYIYPKSELSGDRRPNLDGKLYAAICKAAGIDPADQAGPDDDFRAATGDARPSEVKVFDYIYGVLHSPDFRSKFAEFLKVDFPRIPYPTSPKVFRAVSEKGEQLRRIHLMEPAAIGDAPYAYLGEGDDIVASGYPKFEDGKVYINADQYFENVPEIAWSFHIGGYQPAQKWLKDRRGRALLFDDITHYQRIVKILVETDRIMKEIELPLEDMSDEA